jgi:hypothetical protein
MEKDEEYYIDLIKKIKKDRRDNYTLGVIYPDSIRGDGSFEAMEKNCEDM